MTTLDHIIPHVDQRRMSLRAWAIVHLDMAITHQVRAPSDTANRHLASTIRIASRHGLTDEEIEAVLRDARKESA